LGDEAVKQAFFTVENTYDEWKACGALCVKFYDTGVEDYVVIDDYLPLSEDEDFLFCSSSDKTFRELWP